PARRGRHRAGTRGRSGRPADDGARGAPRSASLRARDRRDVGASLGARPVHGLSALPWNDEPWLAALLAASAILYGAGVARLWRRAGVGRGITRGAVARFVLGWLALVLALVSPLDALGETLFSVHMVQHELLMVVAAPLLVLGRPLEAWAWSLPSPVVQALAGIGRARGLRPLWAAMTEPVGAWCLHALALWAWHAPVLFDAALADERIHIAQHASFLGTALLLWWAVLGRGTRRP